MKSVYIELNYTWGEAGGRQFISQQNSLKYSETFSL